MEFTRKCSNCGFDLTGAEPVCPMCTQPLVPAVKRSAWLGALIQFGFVTTFIVVLRLPRFLIVFFGLFILLAALLSSVLKTKATTRATPLPPRPTPHSALFWIVSLAIPLFGLAFFCFLLFGFVTFANSWTSWHRYEGQPFHRAEFVVEQDYFQPYPRAADLYASGTVEGHREWMDLGPYLHARNLYHQPHGRDELQAWVPSGTSIPIYLFPTLKGRSRVRMYSGTPPAEAYHRTAMNAVQYGAWGMAGCALIIFLLMRIRAACFKQPDSALTISSVIST